MTRIKMIGLAIMAVFAVLAVASASAVAAENPVLVNSAGGAVTNVSVKGTDPTVSRLKPTATGTATVECASEESATTLTTTLAGTGMTSGTSKVTFKKCKTAAGKCANTGTEEITGTVSVLLVWVGKESEKKPGILVSILPYRGNPGSGTNQLLSFKCSGALVDVEGSFIALTSSALNELSTTSKLIAKQKEGVQEDQKYTENGVEGTNSLYSNQGGGPFGPAGEEVETEETYTTSVKIIEN
jgi:hypothetical protein